MVTEVDSTLGAYSCHPARITKRIPQIRKRFVTANLRCSENLVRDAKISELEKNIKPTKKLYKIYWADGTFVGEYWA